MNIENDLESPSKSQATFDTIRSSFLELMSEMSYKKIGIGDITQRASIARQTFYTYFRSKNELLMSFMDEGFDEFFDQIQPMILSLDEIEGVIEMLYIRLADNYEVMSMVWDAGIDDLIYRRFRQYVNRTIGNVLRRSEVQVKDPKVVEFMVDHIVGSHFHMIKHWMQDGMPYSPKEMASLYNAMNNFRHNKSMFAKLLTNERKKPA